VIELEGETTPLADLLGELWGSRALLVMLARKDFYVRYRRAALGVLWAIGLPIVQALVLVAVFSRIVRVATPGTNYAVFVFAGLVAWTFFSATISVAATAIVDGAGLSTRIYFPRAVLPLVSVAANLYGFVGSLAVLVIMALVAGTPFSARLALLVPGTALLVAFTAALGLVLSALHVYFRDIRHIVQAALLAWFYATPVIYPLTLAKGLSRWLVVNPMTGVVELLRAGVVAHGERLGTAVWWSIGWTAALAAIALAVHRRYDRVFVDLL
jgi:ABC-type polysaccharide/polyol phosphate export permease